MRKEDEKQMEKETSARKGERETNSTTMLYRTRRTEQWRRLCTSSDRRSQQRFPHQKERREFSDRLLHRTRIIGAEKDMERHDRLVSSFREYRMR